MPDLVHSSRSFAHQSQPANHCLSPTATNPCTSTPKVTHRQAFGPPTSINPPHPNVHASSSLLLPKLGVCGRQGGLDDLGVSRPPVRLILPSGLTFGGSAIETTALHNRGVLEPLSRRHCRYPGSLFGTYVSCVRGRVKDDYPDDHRRDSYYLFFISSCALGMRLEKTCELSCLVVILMLADVLRSDVAKRCDGGRVLRCGLRAPLRCYGRAK
jgi:hypothetical protein